jgi:hypothetical protein
LELKFAGRVQIADSVQCGSRPDQRDAGWRDAKYTAASYDMVWLVRLDAFANGLRF